jgi:hypothetical protein
VVIVAVEDDIILLLVVDGCIWDCMLVCWEDLREDPADTARSEDFMSPVIGGRGGRAPLVRGDASGLLVPLLLDELLLLLLLPRVMPWDEDCMVVPSGGTLVSMTAPGRTSALRVEVVVGSWVSGCCRLGCLSTSSWGRSLRPCKSVQESATQCVIKQKEQQVPPLASWQGFYDMLACL